VLYCPGWFVGVWGKEQGPTYDLFMGSDGFSSYHPQDLYFVE
jgi:hypothetical protein